jgi:hypothetical protein
LANAIFYGKMTATGILLKTGCMAEIDLYLTALRHAR